MLCLETDSQMTMFQLFHNLCTAVQMLVSQTSICTLVNVHGNVSQQATRTLLTVQIIISYLEGVPCIVVSVSVCLYFCPLA